MHLVDRAATLNKQLGDIKKDVEALKTELKANVDGVIEGDMYIATIKTQNGSKKLNQEKALAVVERLKAKWLLKQVVDEEKLEDAIASGEIDGKEFAGCVDVSTRTVITFKAKKVQK